MYEIVPGALQRLRESDIVSMAGLKIASLGQEYYRKGAVHATKRRGALLSGIVEVSNPTLNQNASATNSTLESQQAAFLPLESYVTEVELRDRISCNVTCSCKQSTVQPTLVCSHAAALLYYWLAHPLNFQMSSLASVSPVPLPFEKEIVKSPIENDSVVIETKQSQAQTQTRPVTVLQTSLPFSNTIEILVQLGLSELRAVARAYEIPTNGLSKQELAEAILTVLSQPETVRRVIATLEKQQRQLLAAFTLAGGFMSDEDLRGLFERFSLGEQSQLQNMLRILQGKALIIRATFNNSLQRRTGAGLNASALEICWYVPAEVSAALHVTIPITPFTIETDTDQSTPAPKVQHIEPYSVLTDLLLVARVLDGKSLEYHGKSGEEVAKTGVVRSLNPLPVDGSIPIPAPHGTTSKALLEYLLTVVPRPLPFLRFAIRVLRLADILYFENDTNEVSKPSKTTGNDISHFTNSTSEPSEVFGLRTTYSDRHKDDAGDFDSACTAQCC